MKHLIIILSLLLMAAPAMAAPYLVCDVQAGVVAYNVDMDGIVTDGIPVQVGWIKANTLYLTDPGGTTTQCHVLLDLATLLVGAHVVKAAGDWGVWGVSGYSVPLALTRPTLTAPQAGRLVK